MKVMHAVVPLAVLATIVTAAAPVAVTSRLDGKVVDDATGQPLAARLVATDACGRPIEVAGEHPHVESLGKRWCYVDGRFSLDVPPEGVKVEIRRGLETRVLTATVETPGAGTIERVFRLRRWTNMRERGYVNGDIHAHTPFPAETHGQMRAEDLDVVHLLTLEDDSLTPFFTGRLDSHSTPGHEIRVSQEVRDWQMGHLTLVGLTKLIPGYPHVGGVLESWVRPHWDLTPAIEQAHAQGGLVVWSHFSNLPGAESPVGIALGLVDAIELMTYDDPTQLPSHWGPWKNSGMPIVEFPVLRGMDLYYQYLNAGFRLPIASGTDKMDVDIPLGSNRTYIPAGRDAGYAEWIQGIKAGRGFITNGPLLEFEVDGHAAGDVIRIDASRKVRARVTARSILPFATLELVRNGEVVGHKTVFVQDNPPVDGVYSMDVEAEITVDRSCWLAARVADDPDNKNRILPRGLSVFAHTNPVYFLRGGAKVREEPSIRYLEKYVSGTLHWLKSGPPFANPADRDKAIRRADQALAVYRSLHGAH